MKESIKIQRNSNIELLRIVAILFVLTVHMTFGVTGFPGSTSYYSVPSIFVEAFALIGVNLFVLISGYFSIVPKKKSVINLCFICLFYGIIKLLIESLARGFSFRLLLFITNSNWFIVAYIGLMLVSPILNAFAKSSNRKGLLGLLISLLFFQFWFGNTEFWTRMSFAHGYSIMSFGILYLIGRYLKIYGTPYWLARMGFALYALLSIMAGGIALVAIKRFSQDFVTEFIVRLFSYNNIIFIASAVALFSFFANLNLPNSKFVNWLAQSSLAVLLLHTIPTVQSFLQQQFRTLNVWTDYNIKNACLGGGNYHCCLYQCSPN